MSAPTAALVTGAAHGIGRATVERLADDDAYDVVACLDIDDTVADVADGLAGGAAYTVDVADHDAVAAAVEEIETTADITFAVNNAGVSRYFWIEDLEPAEWREILDINLTGQYNVARAVTPRMFRRGEGSLVNVSSGAGTQGSVSGGVHYSASKAGVLGLTKGLAKQLAPNVRVNCVVPGLVDTRIGDPDGDAETDNSLWTEAGSEQMIRMVLLERMADPVEIADVIRFLGSDEASYITGATLDVDGGVQLAPTQQFLMPDRSVRPAPDEHERSG